MTATFSDTPSTAASSPTLPTSPTTGDCVIQIIEGDPEKAGYHENKFNGNDLNSPGEQKNAKFPSKLTKYLRKASFSASFPHVPWRQRTKEGRERLVQRIDDHPKGYPQLAAFIDSDENFLMCRRFGFLHSRVLLYRQDELSKLESNLIEMDQLDQEECPLALRSRKTDDARDDIEEQYSRKTLINQIDAKLKEYDDIVKRVKSFVSFKKPSNRNFNSFAAWILSTSPVTREEMAFVKHGDDFVALADGQEGGWFDGFVEDCLGCFPHRVLRKVLSSSSQLKKTDDAYVHLYSKYRIDVLVRLILTVISVVLLMAPTALLFLVPDHPKLKIILIMIFTLLFSAALGVFTKAKRHEMFAATAA